MPQPGQRRYKVIDEDTCRKEAEREGNGNDPETIRNMQLKRCVEWINGHEEFHEEKLERRLRSLEDGKLWVVAAGATLGMVFTILVTVIGLLSGIIKWNISP